MTKLQITKIEVNLCAERNLVAYANIIFNNEFIVRGLRVVEKADGSLLMLMPSRQSPTGDYKDVAHPLTNDCRNRIESIVMEKVRGLRSRNADAEESRIPA